MYIIIKCKEKINNYLNATFNLNDRVSTKPNNKIKYLHKDSKHPPRQIPLSIESRLFTLSFNEKSYQEAVLRCRKAFKNSGYRHAVTNKSPRKTEIGKLF